MREQIRAVMRYAGPRMVYRHPMMTLFHFVDGLRKEPIWPGVRTAGSSPTEQRKGAHKDDADYDADEEVRDRDQRQPRSLNASYVECPIALNEERMNGE